jgi:hypothetical protein
MREWLALAPKVYRYRDGDGDEHVKAKGMSGLDAHGFDLLRAGGTWEVNRGVEGLRTAMRHDAEGVFRRRKLRRTLKPNEGWIGGRISDKNGLTRAPTVSEYVAAFETRRITRGDSAQRESE